MNTSDFVFIRRFGNTAIQVRFDPDVNNNPTYAGYAPKGKLSSEAFWFIVKYTYDVNQNVTLIQSALNDSQIWDNRASLVYS